MGLYFSSFYYKRHKLVDKPYHALFLYFQVPRICFPAWNAGDCGGIAWINALLLTRVFSYFVSGSEQWFESI